MAEILLSTCGNPIPDRGFRFGANRPPPTPEPIPRQALNSLNGLTNLYVGENLQNRAQGSLGPTLVQKALAGTLGDQIRGQVAAEVIAVPRGAPNLALNTAFSIG